MAVWGSARLPVAAESIWSLARCIRGGCCCCFCCRSPSPARLAPGRHAGVRNLNESLVWPWDARRLLVGRCTSSMLPTPRAAETGRRGWGVRLDNRRPCRGLMVHRVCSTRASVGLIYRLLWRLGLDKDQFACTGWGSLQTANFPGDSIILCEPHRVSIELKLSEYSLTFFEIELNGWVSELINSFLPGRACSWIRSFRSPERHVFKMKYDAFWWTILNIYQLLLRQLNLTCTLRKVR